jgi:hypothetical protein
MYRLLQREIDGISDCVDVHSAFAALDDSRTLYADHVHLLPAGDREVAEIYAAYIASIIERR